jgi:hypothetical protein
MTAIALSHVQLSLRSSPFVPLALAFMGLGTGYLTFGPQELLGYPRRTEEVDTGTGVWSIWMPGFMQVFAAFYLWTGLTLFGTFRTPTLYMAAFAFTAYGAHWFAMGWNRMRGTDTRINFGVAVAFTLTSILGIIVFFGSGDNPIGGMFIGLTCTYVAELAASLRPDLPRFGGLAERVLGFLHIAVGFFLMYLMFATVLDTTLRYSLPL